MNKNRGSHFTGLTSQEAVKGYDDPNGSGVGVTSLSSMLIAVMQADPDRVFTIQDLVEFSGVKSGAVRKALSRLSAPGKGSGPVMRISQGLYKYDPLKEHQNLQALVRKQNLKIENLQFVTKRTQGGQQSQPIESENVPNVVDCDPCHSGVPKHNYPINLPTGQRVDWEICSNGTQIIRLVAQGAPPFSPDCVLNLLHFLEKDGFNDSSWVCTSLEVNVDSGKHRIDGSYSVVLMEGILLKAYQHGNNMRLELAIRREISAREVMEYFHSLTDMLDGTDALRRVCELERMIHNVDGIARDAYRMASNTKYAQMRASATSPVGKSIKDEAKFQTASEIKASEKSIQTQPHTGLENSTLGEYDEQK
jgi:hypothetical protein